VKVDEAGRNDQARGVDLADRLDPIVGHHQSQAVAADEHISEAAWRTCAVNDGAAAYQEVDQGHR
jgi:hypothetical protein